ncbi:hypothetical protein X798_03446 [Onchocerca flexuosa]|uniref:Splicing factor YJU2 n=1 Tax=Onchocerca flexuosa TaxID=387005 RepID=A0A238BVY6_9BILA|nr:hypothetical protein X798_03446 [Onchocerca flexuosa]
MTGTERKKYYPPDFDPSKIPRAKGQRNRQFVQRVMAPYNMQCDTCHEYIYKGKKFNMRRETAEGETYLGLKIFRFYFRCPNCLAEITFKTDLENCDYQQEHGATRLFEAFKLYQQEEKAKETKEEEEKKDPMKMLEKRTKMSRAEMEALDVTRHIKIEITLIILTVKLLMINKLFFDLLQILFPLMMVDLLSILPSALRLQEEEDEKFIQKLYGRMEDGKIVKRILDEENEEMDLLTHVKQEIKHEPLEDQKASCSSADVANLKPGTSGQNIMMANKRTSQKELLSRIVAVKKQRMERNESIIIKTEIQDTIDSPEDLPGHSKPKKFEENDRKSQSVSLEPSSSALQRLADYCSDSSGD